jgi:maleate cis-trans isomerase
MAYKTLVPRARIGFIIPSSNRMVEPQMQRFMPDGVVPHFNRIGMTNRHKAPLEQLLPRILDAAELLADSKCDVTVLQCTGTSMSGGVDMEAKVIKEIERATGRPAISAASSITAAFDTLGSKRLVFISESKQDGHDEKKRFLLEAGYELIVDKAAALAGSDEYCIMPPQLWIDMANAHRRDEADTYFLSCANISSIDAIATLERELGKPVVTSNQAALWCSLRMAGIQDAVPGLGRLMIRDLVRAAPAA